jgi:Fe-S oxidoreductase
MMEKTKAANIEEENIEGYLREAFLECEKCHFCNLVCPIVGTRVTQGPFGINRAIYYAVKWNKLGQHLRDLVYSCTTCGKCVVMCKRTSRGLPLKEIFEKAREFLLVERMVGPMPQQVSVLKNMHTRGNPWGNPPHERTKWSEGLDVQFISPDNPVDVLYFVGCASSYDPQAQKIAKNLSRILTQSGVNFGILEQETCSGSEARRMGETDLFEYLSEANMDLFDQAGIKHIVTGDPHSFYSFSQEYSWKGDKPRIQHYTQFLCELFDQGVLKFSRAVHKTVTYHDPCYLGRHGEIFAEPRKLIKSIPGIELVEMENVMEDSDCCGMGGGRMWMEPPKGLVSSQTIAEKRIGQAIATGASAVLTACPFCNITLNDAVKSLHKEDIIQVMDITEIISMGL